jgi:biotin carboxyl carrier protein
MTNKTYTIDNTQVEISQQADQLLVNGKPIDALVVNQCGSEVKILVGEQVYSYDMKEKSTTRMRLQNKAQEFVIEWQAAAPAAPVRNDAVALPARKVVKAPLPGVVVKLVAVPGQKIKKNDVVLVIESMKMQIDVRSTFEGVLKSMLVKIGDQMEVDSLVAEIE